MLDLTKSAVDVGIVVANLEAQRGFYGDVLGLPYAGVLSVPGGKVHVYICGETLIKLYKMSEGAPVDVAAFGTRAGLSYFTLSLRDLGGTFEKLREKGATVLAEPGLFEGDRELAAPVGRLKARFALVADADGNMVELFEYVD
nr:VOC family protein [Sphingomonas sp. Y57]